MTDATKESHVESPDLSPIEMDRIEFGNHVLVIDPPLILKPMSEPETGPVLMVEDHEFNLFAGMETREELEEEIKQHLLFMWREYALEDLDNLTADAQQLRELLRSRMREENAP